MQIVVHTRYETLFTGEAALTSGGKRESEWSVVFEVPAASVSQFQMRRGERVRVEVVSQAMRYPALIEGFWLDEDAGFSGFSGIGHVRLVGEGPSPA